MAQTLLLGLGGTGSKIVNNVVLDLKKNGIKINDGNICCAVLDTNNNDNELIEQTGTGIPVIGTSKDRNIEDYMAMYGYKGAYEWMPLSPELLTQSMEDGASQMRVKSRLALMDTIEDRSILDLERLIDKLFDNRDNNKIRVMIVSSLAGGTGAGSFIQVALWLRKFFLEKKRCQITIRGIFLLPDIFVRTLKDVLTDPGEIQSQYANAYAAIQEMNAITKIKTKGAHTMCPIKIDGLFDSEKNQQDGFPVYDYAFFIDETAENGSVLETMAQYEKVAARLVYMQLYAPMHNDLYSEEDNLFKRFQRSKEPVFGSCGTARATYPKEDVLYYCAHRAAKDSISTGWRVLDDEIRVAQEKENEREQSGAMLIERLNPRTEYMRRFEAKTKKTGDEVGADRLFVEIAGDQEELVRVAGESGKDVLQAQDKIEVFLSELDRKIETIVSSDNPGNWKAISLSKKKKTDKKEDSEKEGSDKEGKEISLPEWAQKLIGIEAYIDLVDEKNRQVSRCITNIKKDSVVQASAILETVCPVSMGDINYNNKASIYGLLSKEDSDGNHYFIHPLVARYLLYKLADKLDEIKLSLPVKKSEENIKKGHGDNHKKVDFDNKKTRATEDSPIEFLKSKKITQREEKFLKEFAFKYEQFNANQTALCCKYAIYQIKHDLLLELSKRLEKLIEVYEEFFKKLIKVSNTLDAAIERNIEKNNEVREKTIYVCASKEEKEGIYCSLGFNAKGSNKSVNGMVVKALYGQFCAQENKTAKSNAEYVGKNVADVFYKVITNTYTEEFDRKYKDEIDMDIFSAIGMSTDIAFKKAEEKKEKEPESEILDVDLDTGEAIEKESARQRQVRELKKLVRRLSDLGAPFLMSNTEQPEDKDEHLNAAEDMGELENELFIPIKKRKTFWGFHPILVEKCPELAVILGVDVERQKNEKCKKYDLECYRAVYGIQARYIPKFNEVTMGEYYRNYSQVIQYMERNLTEDDKTALIQTPHLDKRWHLFLPYVTPEKQMQEDLKFYRLFWLAVAYGKIRLDNQDRFEVERTLRTPAGNFPDWELLKYNGKSIRKHEIFELFATLRLDGSFARDAAVLERNFVEDCEKRTYKGTKFLYGILARDEEEQIAGPIEVDVLRDEKKEGGLAVKSELNAVTLMVKYAKNTRYDKLVLAVLIQTLEALCYELAVNKYYSHEHNKIQNRAMLLCKEIYDASDRGDKGEVDAFKRWDAAWKNPLRED